MKETCDTCIHAEVCKYTKELNGCDFWQNPLEKVRFIRDKLKTVLNLHSLTHVVGYDKGFVDGIDKVVRIIDKYTKGE